ncbi:MAG: cell division ATP-binding protein FtsE [Alphaproteobacteria bacterium]
MIHFENVSLRYGSNQPRVLKDVNLHLPRGSFNFLLGPSGAGKSSLLKLMYFIEKPISGSIQMFDRDIATLTTQERPVFRRRIGFVFQDYRLLPHLSAKDNVALPLRIAGAKEDKIDDHVIQLMRWVGLQDYIDASPATLSGGQQQRLAFARAVINRPSILLADEPTGSVDQKTARRIYQLFRDLHSLGTTIFIATHNMELVEEFGHPCYHIEDGELSDPEGRRL